jgi:hypothetical protein
VVTGGGSLGEGIHLWDMRKLDKPMKAFGWEGTKNEGIAQKIDKYFVNPTVNVVKFAPIAGTLGLDSDFIMAGCRDRLNESHVKCIATRTGAVVNEFKYVKDSCLSLDVSRDGSLAVLADTTGVLHMENINLMKKDFC